MHTKESDVGWCPLDVPNRAKSLDPYLQWAAATCWRDYRGAGAELETIVVIVELSAMSNKNVAKLAAALKGIGEVRRAYEKGATAFCTCLWTTAVFEPENWARIEPLLARFNLAMDLLPQRSPRRPRREATLRPEASSEGRLRSEGDTLLGIIDTNFAFAHRDFRSPTGDTRILHLWDQDQVPVFDGVAGGTPSDFGYGCEISRRALRSIAERTFDTGFDEGACYEEARYPELRARFAHGTAVASLMAGPMPLASRVPLKPGALPNFIKSAKSDADIVLVQLPRTAVQDGAGHGLAAHVLDGLRFILSCAGPSTQKVVVNLSFAYQTGPHDGTSLLEAALDELVRECAAGKHPIDLEVVLPTGNTYLDRCHARFGLTPAEKDLRRTLSLAVPPDNEVSTFIEVWLPPSEDISVELVTPSGESSQRLAVGHAQALKRGGQICAGLIHAKRSPRGLGKGSMALIAISPTKAQDSPEICAPAGRWTIHIRSAMQASTEIRACIAFNQRNAGAVPRSVQARFVDAEWDPLRYLRPALDDPAVDTPIKRRGTISGIATGSGATAVAGNVWRGAETPVPKPMHYGGLMPERAKEHAFYSGAECLAEPKTPMPQKRFVSAACEESWALAGIPAAGSRSGSTVRARGTSFAAPQVARQLAQSTLLSIPHGSIDRDLSGEGSSDP